MRRQLSNRHDDIPQEDIDEMAGDWSKGVDFASLDPRIMAIEAAALVKQYNRTHVKELGNLTPSRPDGVLRWMYVQVNSASSEDVRVRKTAEIKDLVEQYDVQGVALVELGFNWSSVPASANLSSWFKEWRDCISATSHNRHESIPGVRHQQGGCGLLAFGSLRQYVRKRCPDFRHLGRWCSWLVYDNPAHKTRFVAGYNVGRPKPTHYGTQYQQHLRYIQHHDLETNPRRLFAADFLAVLLTWRRQGERIIIFWDANENILDGPLCKLIMERLDMVEVFSQHWEGEEPNTHIRGSEAIDGCMHTKDIESSAALLKSFHNSCGDHRTGIVDFTTQSVLGKDDFNPVRPPPRRLSTRHKKGLNKYIKIFEDQMDVHSLQQRLDVAGASATSYPAPLETQAQLESIDKQTVEIGLHAAAKCRKIYKPPLPFSQEVHVWDERKKIYNGLLRRLDGRCHNGSNIIRQAWKFDITNPQELSRYQCLDGVRYCKGRLMELKKVAKGLRKVHLRNRLIQADESGDKVAYKGVLQTIEREEKKRMWPTINRSVDDPRLGATDHVQRLRRDGTIENITDKDAMNAEIQYVTEQRFDLAHSAPITMSSLATKLGYLSDTEFAKQLLGGHVNIPSDVDDTTTLVLEEIAKIGMTVETLSGDELVITPEKFRHYWKQVKEETSSSASGFHIGHYRAATHSDKITKFFSDKLTIVARCGCPPERWGVGLQVLLEKIAGVALVNKLRAILLMEADYNYLNKYIFGYEALNSLAAEGYLLDEQYNQGESTAEDAKMDERLTFDISRQLRQPMASTSADAANCYDRINHLIMSFLLLSITGCIGAVACLLYPIQTMKFFQRTARGDSTTFFGGPGRSRPLQGLCQGNTAAPGCTTMLFAVLLHIYNHQGFGSSIMSPVSRHIIECIGTQFVDDTNLYSTAPALRSSQEVYSDMQQSVTMWGNLLNCSGGAFKPIKSYWYNVDYTCNEWGIWDYAELVNSTLTVPLPDGSHVPIRQLGVHDAEKMLGVYSSPSGDDSTHLQLKIIDRIEKWTNRTKNSHLPSKYAWVSYRFKLWPGVRYGLATLATPLAMVVDLLSTRDFHMLSFLGVNRNIKKGWRNIPRAFGGVGLFSLPAEQLICWLNMLIQHFGVPSVLGRKFRASLEALQLEVGVNTNPLNLDYSKYEMLATRCWFKSVWERMWYYSFTAHLELEPIPFPREGDSLMSTLFLERPTEVRIALNRCRIRLEMLFLSDIVTANGRQIEKDYLIPTQTNEEASHSRFTFGREQPTPRDWVEWTIFWAQFTDSGLALHRPLGRWVAPSHRIWQWYFDPASNQVEEVVDGVVRYYGPSAAAGTRTTRSNVIYGPLATAAGALPLGLPTTVEHRPDNTVALKECGPPLASCPSQPDEFWQYLRSWGGAWMWDNVEEETQDLRWLADALSNGTAVLVTDGSYDKKRAPRVSGAGWVITCRTAQKFLRGSFHEDSPRAGSYRGELLGLVALHTLALALVQFYGLKAASGKLCCDNISALFQSKKNRRRVRTGSKHADLLRALRTIKCHHLLQLTYEHVRSHQDKYLLWHQMSLEAQLNVDCDHLAKGAVHRRLSASIGNISSPHKQLLPLEKAAIFVNGGEKLTSDVGEEIRFYLGKEEARAFYTAPNTKEGKGLGWSAMRFNAVDWRAINDCLATKSDMFGLWLSKQVAGVCATRKNVARIQDLLDDRCPNCLQPGETSTHLNLCPAEGRVQLFEECVEDLEKWMEQDNRTDSELAYWIAKYILMRGKKPFAELGPMSPSMLQIARCQDIIGWQQFMEGRITTEIRFYQSFHCAASPCRMNGDEWTKHFISRLLQISHGQWVLRNFTLHDQTRGYIRLRDRRQVLAEIDQLADVDPDLIPPDSRFLLEVDYSSLLRASFERQSYWVMAMKAARRAGRRAAVRRSREGASDRRRNLRLQQQRRQRQVAQRPVVNTTAVERQILEDTVQVSRTTRRRPHPASIEFAYPSNKRLRKPD